MSRLPNKDLSKTNSLNPKLREDFDKNGSSVTLVKLIKLELRKNNIKPYLLSVLGIFIAVIALGILFCAVPILEPNDPYAQGFSDPNMIITMVSIMSMSAFAILSSVMYAKFVIEEYTGRKNVLLFTYPQKRSSILFAKFALIFVFVFVMMFTVNLTACVSVGFLGNAVALISQPFANINLMLKLSLIFAFVANFIGLISLRIGFYKKSIIVPVVTATILVSPFGNAVMLLGTDSDIAFVIAGVVLFFVSAFLFGGLLNNVNNMECAQGVRVKKKRVKLWQKDFTLVVIGQIISLFGNGILRFALPLYLLNITGSPALFGAVSAVAFVPLVLLMPIGGIIADRTNKRNVMVILDFLTGFLMLFFYLTMDTISLIPLLIATLMILYSIGGLYQPTVQASVPILLDERVLAQGNGIVGSIGALANLVAPIIGGILLGSFGIAPIIIVSIICFFASAILEMFIKIPHKKEIYNSSLPRMVKDDFSLSIKFIFKEKPALRRLMFVICLINGLISALIIISLPVLISERLFLSEEMYGYSQGVLALGGLFGGIMAGVFGAKLHIKSLYKYIVLVALSLIPMSVAMIIRSAMASYVLILISAFFAMCISSLASVMIITFIQSQTAENMVGKVMAFVMTVGLLASPLGQAAYGIAFEYLIGYESLVVMGAVLMSLLAGIYAKRISFE